MSTVVINVVASNPYYRGFKSLDGYQYQLDFSWNTTTEKWYLNLKSLSTDISIDIKGICLLPGKDLLLSHGYIELGELWVVDNQNTDAPENPNYTEFGSRWTLEYTPVA